MRRASRIDDSHHAVVAALRAVGASVQSLAEVGNGCPDLLVGYHGEVWLLEIKDGSKSPSARKLTPDQEAWHREWRGGHLSVVTSVDDALWVIGAEHYKAGRAHDA